LDSCAREWGERDERAEKAGLSASATLTPALPKLGDFAEFAGEGAGDGQGVGEKG
jgi:hypothetical protein